MHVRDSDGRFWSNPYYIPVQNGPFSLLTDEEITNLPWGQARLLVTYGNGATFIFPRTTLSARLVDVRTVLMQEIYPVGDFAMAGHSRLGAESPAHQVAGDSDLLRLINSFI
jgi:hypothetical protein